MTYLQSALNGLGEGVHEVTVAFRVEGARGAKFTGVGEDGAFAILVRLGEIAREDMGVQSRVTVAQRLVVDAVGFGHF